MTSRIAAICAVLLGAAGARTACAQIGAQMVTDGLVFPTAIAHAPGDATRLFVSQKVNGAVRIVELSTGQIRQDPFLRLDPSRFSASTERGLLGLAFHPDYQTNGLFYICYTGPEGEQIVEEFAVSAGDPNLADPASARRIISIPRQNDSHVAGWIGFGPHDGMLYIASGDDVRGVLAQFTQGQLLGKLLRVDIGGDDFPSDPDRNYAIPPNNPFVGIGGDDEIMAFGLRNPWRCAFDEVTADLFIADVGESAREEVSVFRAEQSGVLNYGWPCFEGSREFQPLVCDPGDPLEAPLHDYDHGDGCAVIGGVVYRGCAIEALVGAYFFADFCSGRVWSFRYDRASGQAAELAEWTEQLAPVGGTGGVTTFGLDAAGEMYIATTSSLYKVTPDEPGGCCYADCNGDRALDIFDFICFQDAFAAGLGYSDCNDDQAFDIFDFICFQDAFAGGCS